MYSTSIVASDESSFSQFIEKLKKNSMYISLSFLILFIGIVELVSGILVNMDESLENSLINAKCYYINIKLSIWMIIIGSINILYFISAFILRKIIEVEKSTNNDADIIGIEGESDYLNPRYQTRSIYFIDENNPNNTNNANSINYASKCDLVKWIIYMYHVISNAFIIMWIILGIIILFMQCELNVENIYINISNTVLITEIFLYTTLVRVIYTIKIAYHNI
jgi:hypothetical protein